MNPDQPSREHIEARLTALLLGELPADEVELLRYTIAHDPALKKLHDELAATIVLVHEAVNAPADAPTEKAEPLKLSGDRREKLLAHFQTAPKDEPLFWLKRINVPSTSALITTTCLLLLIVGLIAISIPNFVKSRATSPANAVINNLRQIDAAKNQWALENNKSPDAVPTSADLSPYLKNGGVKPVAGESYVIGKVSDSVIAEADTIQTKYKLGSAVIRLPSEDRPQGQLSMNGAVYSETSTSGQAQLAMGDKAIAPPAPAPAPAAMPPLSAPRIALPPPESQALVFADNSASGQIAAVDKSQIAGDANSMPLGVTGGGGEDIYVIKSGDTLSKIAQEHGTTVKALEEANNLTSTKILAGKKMKLPEPPASDFSGTTFAVNEPVTSASIPAGASGGGGGYGGGNVSAGSTFQMRMPNNTGSTSSSEGYEAERSRKSFGQENSATSTDLAFAGPPASAAIPVEQPPTLAQAELPKDVAIDSWGVNDLHQKIDPTAVSGLSGSRKLFAPAQKPRSLSQERVEAVTAAPAAPAAMPPGQLPDLAQAQPPKEEARTRTLDFEDSFSETGAEKVPVVVGDVPVAGNLFKSSYSFIVATNIAENSSKFQLQSGVVAGDDLTKTDGSLNKSSGSYYLAGTNTLALNGVNAFAGKSSDRDDVSGLNYQLSTNAVAIQKRKGGTINSTPACSALTPVDMDRPLPKPAPGMPIPQPEFLCAENNFSTFALNVSDVSFQLAAASLERGQLPDPASIRSEEFINAFDYRDPAASVGQPMAFATERARDPFAQNRDLLRFSVKTSAIGRPAGRALNLVVLLDISGSMERADRVAIIHEALRVLASQLQPQDTVSVVTFARTARLWADGISGDKAGETLDRVGGITPEGGTNLEEAMRLAYEAARRHYLANGMNRVVLLTDGAANLGDVDPKVLQQNVETQRKQGIALDCFGVGYEDYNDDLLEQLSSHGDGRYAFLNSPEDASTEFATKLAGALQIAAQDVKVQVEFNPQRVISWRQIGYAKHQLTKEQFRDNTVAAGEIAAQEAGNALYTVETKPDGIGPVATVRVRYRVPGTQDYQEKSWLVDYNGTAPALEQASPAMRLTATAGAFSEWLATSPFAQEVTLDELQKILTGVPQVYGADERPKKLETMLREARSISGK
ncbi:MAG TPA: von Willebrand factor type A domain-containing protein [Candidatus Sulfotelmatobacter sp.]|jgi:Mg-chelatase subunit ChlD/LysM repeat protein/anti-sigma factor RsiW|nr:von Willebrand factor type A domain-containing protein [Candidatus Sulfotelmatobacter sp.]